MGAWAEIDRKLQEGEPLTEAELIAVLEWIENNILGNKGGKNGNGTSLTTGNL